ncbi:MAG: hypothetical protein AAFV53_03240 [Myxococcota bacterium]
MPLITTLALSILSAPVLAGSDLESETWTQLTAQDPGMVLRVALDASGTISGPVVITGAGVVATDSWLRPSVGLVETFDGAYTERAELTESVTVAISGDEVPSLTAVSVAYRDFPAIDNAPERSFTDLVSTQLAQPLGGPLLVAYGDDIVSFDHPIIAFDHPIIAFDHPIIASLVDEISGAAEGDGTWREDLEEVESNGDVVVITDDEQIALRCLDEAEGNYAGHAFMQHAAEALAVSSSGVLSVVVRQATVETAEASSALTFSDAEGVLHTEHVEPFVENTWLQEGDFVDASATLGDLSEADGETVWVVSVGFVSID